MLFAAFGRQTVDFVRGISPSLALLTAKRLRVAGAVGAVAIWIFTKLLTAETKDADQALGFGIAGILIGAATWRLAYFLAGLMDVATEAAVAPGRGIFAAPAQEDGEEEEEEPEPVRSRKTKKRKTQVVEAKPVVALPPAPRPAAPASEGAVFEAANDDDATWLVNLDAMFLSQGGQSFRLRRTAEGRWQVRDEAKEWVEIDECLETIIDTRWRRYVRG